MKTKVIITYDIVSEPGFTFATLSYTKNENRKRKIVKILKRVTNK